MKNISTGTGIALLAGAIVAYPILDRVMPKADASATHIAAVVAAATAQVEPTIVWYQALARPYPYAQSSTYGQQFWLVRAWSDARIEACVVNATGPLSDCNPNSGPVCIGPWIVVSEPAQGRTYRSDINFDSKVDGADLGTLLADWGDAPRQDVPPSDCPLDLINP